MAFWNFGKTNGSEAKPHNESASPKDIAIDISTSIIDFQLKLAGQLPGFEQAFCSNFTRGYFVGCFNAAMQAFKIDGYQDDARLAAFIAIGHIKLLGEEHGVKFAGQSMSLQGNRDYDLGNRTGGQELIDYLNKKIDTPTQLFKYFKGN
ncbi:hypothetical protein ACQKO7_21320 [Pseudomonas putida]|uniref:hypothetical protein n=1 Tax=Pseudomonas putida TaxID=303 RepID=UPI003CFBC8A5